MLWLAVRLTLPSTEERLDGVCSGVYRMWVCRTKIESRKRAGDGGGVERETLESREARRATLQMVDEQLQP